MDENGLTLLKLEMTNEEIHLGSMPFTGWRLLSCRLAMRVLLVSWYPTWVNSVRVRMMKCYLPLLRKWAKFSRFSMTRPCSLVFLKSWPHRVRLLLESRPQGHWTRSVIRWVMRRSRMFMHLLWLSWHRVSGSLHASLVATCSKTAIREQEFRRRSSERSSSSYVTKISPWSEGHAPVFLVSLPLNWRSSIFFKKSSPFLGSFPRMSRTWSESCALSHWFQWQGTSQRRRIRFTPSALFSLLVRTSLGKSVFLLQKTFHNLQTHLAKK